jgi:hypothetical protein
MHCSGCYVYCIVKVRSFVQNKKIKYLKLLKKKIYFLNNLIMLRVV